MDASMAIKEVASSEALLAYDARKFANILICTASVMLAFSSSAALRLALILTHDLLDGGSDSRCG